jgi:hypothetical protein
MIRDLGFDFFLNILKIHDIGRAVWNFRGSFGVILRGRLAIPLMLRIRVKRQAAAGHGDQPSARHFRP